MGQEGDQDTDVTQFWCTQSATPRIGGNRDSAHGPSKSTTTSSLSAIIPFITIMFDLLEIDDMICQHLDNYDLIQCAQVNVAWNKVVIPHLWEDLSYGWLPDYREDFRAMVREDFLEQEESQEQDKSLEHQNQPTSSSSCSILAKYGYYVRKLPDPRNLIDCLNPPRDTTWSTQSNLSKEPPAVDLARHLYRHCPSIQVEYLHMQRELLDSDDVFETIAEYILPRVRHLYVGGRHHGSLQSQRLKYLLEHCSSALESLTLGVAISDAKATLGHGEKDKGECEVKYREEHPDKGSEEKQQEPNPWPLLKELRLLRCGDISKSMEFWPWLWSRCCHVERLKVVQVDDIILQDLAENMLTHIPSLNEIYMGQGDTAFGSDDYIEALLSGSQYGWRVIEVVGAEDFGMAAKKALMNHLLTLEVLVLDPCTELRSKDLVLILSSCPNLRTLVAMCDAPYQQGAHPLEYETFIDQDPNTGSLKTWACESSLKILKVNFTRIPRSDLEGLVYDRLARMMNLETLWLGRKPHHHAEQEYDSDCLEVTLNTGMESGAGLGEVQWMAENWPKLRTLYGLEEGDDQKVEWLKEHYPEIRVSCWQ
ncbi:hypothetical protein BGZ65_006477 [Modicella reniformis]|uniref:F-box domain-containing protein n=1 Tax=Modicella reniformis TaxID=1440133 RepID=A0A9P6LTV0_9FUNG|nr:hypothetical protein BGZ65_006477 [Modicella reniformis]